MKGRLVAQKHELFAKNMSGVTVNSTALTPRHKKIQAARMHNNRAAGQGGDCASGMNNSAQEEGNKYAFSSQEHPQAAI